MRSVNVAELKNQLSKYLAFAKNGEEIVIRDRSLPVARLLPFLAENANEQELLLVAAGKLRMPRESVDLEKLPIVPTRRTSDHAVTATLLEEREQSR
jgi:prevent-host-death family protein